MWCARPWRGFQARRSIACIDASIDTIVGNWLSSMKRVLKHLDNVPEDVRRALEAAYEARAKVGLQTVASTTKDPVDMTAIIEQVRSNDLVISRPVIGGAARPLVTGESLVISFALDSLGHLSGKTRVLGRINMPSGGTRPLYGYRLAFPREINVENRRSFDRTMIGFDLAAEAALYPPDGGEPAVRGIVQDVSLTGMQIRTGDTKVTLREGETARLVVDFPPPVDTVEIIVHIVRLDPGPNPQQRIVGVTFDKKIEGLAELIQETQHRRDLRQRAG